ncbi:hypothetical protein ACFWBG_22030 [Nocardia salmonicida]|uniref:hypothetical protein n=1 Tax=Nocardia salmonicida TaxID=53431 RepID=UPI00366B6C37
MSKDRAVSRPLKKVEFEIRFATREAEKGWVDARATARNALVDAWDFLTRSPQERCDRCYPLRGDLNKVTIGGETFERWQYKITDGGRIWYAVARDSSGGGTVHLVLVTLGHPNETDSGKNYR